MYSNAGLDQLWNKNLFSKQSDSTLQLFGKTLSYSLISSNTPYYDDNSPHNNPYNTLRLGLHDKFINLTPLFTPTWFSGAFIAFFGYQGYNVTQYGIFFSTFLFIQATITLIIKFHKTISIKYNLKQNITIFSSIAHGFFNIHTAEMVIDFNDTHHHKPKLALKGSKSSPMTHVIDNPQDDFSNSDDQTNHITTPTGFTSPPPFYTNRPNKFTEMSRFKLLPERKQNLHPKTKHKTSRFHSSTVQNPTLTNYSTVNTTLNDYSLDNTSAINDNDSHVKVYSKTNYPFAPPSF